MEGAIRSGRTAARFLLGASTSERRRETLL
jgi:hypothetical protein